MNDRLFPARPILAVSAAVFRRQLEFPHCPPRPRAADWPFQPSRWRRRTGRAGSSRGRRELMEEVGVEAEIIAFKRHVEAIAHEGDRVRMHFVIASFVARWTNGEARPSDEVDAIDWIDPQAGPPSPTTPGSGEILMSATRIASQHS